MAVIFPRHLTLVKCMSWWHCASSVECYKFVTMEAMKSMGYIPTWTLGDRLRKARVEKGYSTAELAQKIGMSRATVSSAENGKNEPYKNTVKLWALATGVDFYWLLTGETPAPSDDGTGVEYRAPSQIRTDDLFFKRRQTVIKRHHLRALQAA